MARQTSAAKDKTDKALTVANVAEDQELPELTAHEQEAEQRRRAELMREAELKETDFFEVKCWTADHIDVDERSAILVVTVEAKESLQDLVATNVKLQVDRSSIPPRVTVGQKNKTGVGRTAEESWSLVATISDLSLGGRKQDKVLVEVKTGFFAGVDIELKGDQTALARALYAVMIADKEKYGSADPVSAQTLRFRVTCDVGVPTTTTVHIKDAEEYHLVISDKILDARPDLD